MEVKWGWNIKSAHKFFMCKQWKETQEAETMKTYEVH